MFKTTNKNRIGYGILTLGVVLGLFFSYRNDAAIEDVNIRQSELIEIQREFIIDQCDRDKIKDQVIIKNLQDEKFRVAQTLKNDPVLSSFITERLNKQIRDIRNAKPCKIPKEK